MCGIAGIISTEKTTFNVNDFNILGTLNDERGGDSCGIFIDGQVEYGIGNRNLFRNFTLDVDYPESASIALLHCRKASPGYPVTLEQAQPIVIKRNDKIEFVLMHNGTISNIRELASKYLQKIDTWSMSDSQILAEIIYKCGYNVLTEYTGCAVLVMVDYRSGTPKVFAFKGSSCYNEGKTKSERPLVYMVNDGKFYFSSMYSALYCINHKDTIYEFPVNQLCQIKNNKIYLVKEIDRTKLRKDTYNIRTIYQESSIGYVNDNLYYNQPTGTYMLNGTPAHGEYVAYPSGYLVYKPYGSTNYGHTFYFFHGRLLYNKESYEFLKNIDDLFEEDVLPIYCPEVIDYFAYNPRIIDNTLTTVDENFNYIKYKNGSYVILFGASDLVSVKDSIRTSKYIYANTALDMFETAAKGIFFDFEELEGQIMQFITNRLIN